MRRSLNPDTNDIDVLAALLKSLQLVYDCGDIPLLEYENIVSYLMPEYLISGTDAAWHAVEHIGKELDQDVKQAKDIGLDIWTVLLSWSKRWNPANYPIEMRRLVTHPGSHQAACRLGFLISMFSQWPERTQLADELLSEINKMHRRLKIVPRQVEEGLFTWLRSQDFTVSGDFLLNKIEELTPRYETLFRFWLRHDLVGVLSYILGGGLWDIPRICQVYLA